MVKEPQHQSPKVAVRIYFLVEEKGILSGMFGGMSSLSLVLTTLTVIHHVFAGLI